MTLGYYPFGLKQKGYNNTVNGGNDLAQNWKFAGREYNQDLGIEWYDFGARNYDHSLGRWMNIDPLAEKYYDKSTYIYALNNPIFFIDPDGREVDVTNLMKGKSEDDVYLLINLMYDLSQISGQNITTSTNKGKTILKVDGNCKEGCENTSESGKEFINHLLSSDTETIKVKGSFSGTFSSSNNKISLDAEQINGAQKGLDEAGLDSRTSNTGMVFLHEALHTKAGAAFYDSDEDKNKKDRKGVFPDPLGGVNKATKTGPVVDKINKFREEMKLPIRYIYGNTKGSLFFEIEGNKQEIKYTNQPVSGSN